VIDIPIRGYGAALYGAVLRARGRHCIMGDSDDSYDFSRLEPFVEALRGGADLVMRNRLQGGIMPGAMPWKNRYSGNPVLSGIGRILFGCPAGGFPLRYARLQQGGPRTHGSAHHGDGVRVGNGHQGHADGDEDQGSADDKSRRALAAAASAPLSPRLAASALHVVVQPRPAVPLSGLVLVLCGLALGSVLFSVRC
jgi:hypothetical protein